MRAFTTVLCLAPLVLLPAAIADGVSGTTDRIDCYYNESSWELAWGFPFQFPPDYGAVAEGYDAGDAIRHLTHVCMLLSTPDPLGWVGDVRVYVWSGWPPGQVLAMRVETVALPPTTPAQVEVEIPVDVTSLFTVGFWCFDFGTHFYVAADQDGLFGHPWVNIPPGCGYPTGWQDPSVTGTEIQSLGIGFLYDTMSQDIPDENSVEPVSTWGQIKRLFR